MAKLKTYDVELSRTLDHRHWDAFLESASEGQYEQTSKWAKIKSVDGWRPLRIVVTREGSIIAGTQILIRPMSFIGSIGYISKGPILPSGLPAVSHLFMGMLKWVCRKHRIQYLHVRPPDATNNAEGWLIRNGFKVDSLVEVDKATTVIDLSASLDEIMGNMTKNNRRFIRHGVRKGTKISEGSKEDIHTFFQMMLETCRRQGVAPNPSTEDFFQRIWEVFHSQGSARLFLAVYREKVISGLFCIPFKNVFRAWKLGWSGLHGNIRPNQVMFWEVIKLAKREGYHYFDFVGIDHHAAEDVLRGIHFSKVAKGDTFFKLMFGGQVRIFPDTHYYIYNPILRLIYGKIYPALVNQRLFQETPAKYLRIPGFLQSHLASPNTQAL